MLKLSYLTIFPLIGYSQCNVHSPQQLRRGELSIHCGHIAFAQHARRM